MMPAWLQRIDRWFDRLVDWAVLRLLQWDP